MSHPLINLLGVANDIRTYLMPTWNDGAAALNIIRFNEGEFNPAAYDIHQIECPPVIAASVMQRQASFFHGRLAARAALVPFGLGHCQVGTGPSREPVWPPGVIGSISHNPSYAGAVAVMKSSNGRIGVGMDIESVVNRETKEVLAESVLSISEFDYLCRLDAGQSVNALISLVFSAKESFFKASFHAVGKYFDFDAVEVEAIDSLAQVISLRVKIPLAPELPAGTQCQVHFLMLDDDTILTTCDLPPWPFQLPR